MLRRMEAKDEPFPDPPATRDRRYQWYQQLAASGRYTVVDGTQPRDAIHAQIVASVDAVR